MNHKHSNHKHTQISPSFFGYAEFNATSETIEKSFEIINKNRLFQVGFGYSAKNKNKEEQERLIKNTVYPEYESMKKNIIENNILKPVMLYGFYKTVTENDTLYFYNKENEKIKIPLERMTHAPYKSIIDFYNEEGDFLAFTLISVGTPYHEFTKNLYDSNEYKEYYFYAALGTYLAESTASIMHYELEEMLGINKENKYKKYLGCRYSFGYKALENMYGNKIIYDALNAKNHGINLSLSFMFEPEFTTATIVSFCENAHYFTYNT